MKEMGTIRKS